MSTDNVRVLYDIFTDQYHVVFQNHINATFNTREAAENFIESMFEVW